MRSMVFGLTLLLAAGVLSANEHGRHGNVSINVDGDGDVTDCGDVRVTFDGERARVVAQDVAFGGNTLRIRSENSGGIRVAGGSRWGVTVCKAVAPGEDVNAISVSARGDEIVADGPSNERWMAYYLITAPRGAVLDLAAENGPIALAGVDGSVTARAVNGPVSVKNSGGNIDATTTNGPISLAGGSGTVKLTATNGPVSVRLDGSGWNGTLDASTTNGPVSLKLPRGYHSGIVLESNGHGPISCKAGGCPEVQKRNAWNEWETPRRIELGSGPQVIHLATTNGPVSVKEAD